MTDTPDSIRKMYSAFIMKKSDAERFQMAFDMAEVGQRMVETQFRQQHPNWSESELKAAVFERIYRSDFAPEDMERIKKAIITYHQNT